MCGLLGRSLVSEFGAFSSASAAREASTVGAPLPEVALPEISRIRQDRDYRKFIVNGSFDLDLLKSHCHSKPRFLAKALRLINSRTHVTLDLDELFDLMQMGEQPRPEGGQRSWPYNRDAIRVHRPALFCRDEGTRSG